ncbi:MAG: hypothetical protein Q8L41_03395 [Anaerolineales bacterium]|nr:hypothetical protein [Anaerolineales bacterium]
MKRIAILVVVVLVMIFVTACGASAPAATQAPVSQPPSQPVATEPAAQPIATESSTGANSTEVMITLDDNTISASLTTFQVSVPYTFVITNAGTRAHNFNISQPVSIAGGLDAALQTALLAVPKSELNSGAKVTVPFIFPETASSTQFEFSCLITRHYDDGMQLAISVTK